MKPETLQRSHHLTHGNTQTHGKDNKIKGQWETNHTAHNGENTAHVLMTRNAQTLTITLQTPKEEEKGKVEREPVKTTEKDIIRDTTKAIEEDQHIAKTVHQHQKDRMDQAHQQETKIKNKEHREANLNNQKPACQHRKAHQERQVKGEVKVQMDGEDHEDCQKTEYRKPHHVSTT